jgi:SAM-dependent methyltransferase
VSGHGTGLTTRLRRLLSTLFSDSESSANRGAFETRDVFATGLFPLCPATHDVGLSRLFDLATLLLLLDCRPGDTVLDIGAGSGFSSEMLARLGYDVLAVDPDLPALQHNRRRPTWDHTRIDGTVRVTQGLAEHLPFKDTSFDGVLGMNVLHHLPELHVVISELARVLKPGARAVFAEPGLDHLEQGETQRAIRDHGENDRAFDVVHFLWMARANGFKEAMLTATLLPPLRLLPIEEVEQYVSGQHSRRHLTPGGVFDELHRRHPYAMLAREGARPKTSRHPGLLKGRVSVETFPSSAARGAQLRVIAHALNAGDTLWEATPRRRGGFVTVGCKLVTPEGRLLNDTLGRTLLPRDVRPGDTVTVEMSIELPSNLQPGPYEMRFDLVDELICWFADTSGESPLTRTLAIE